MTRNEARKIIKTHTQTRYSNSVLLLLLRVVDLTYRKDKDNAEREIETTTASLMRAAAVGDKQLGRIIDRLSADGVLSGVERSQRHVTCHLNLEPLTRLKAYGADQKTEKKAKAADRARKAREQRQKYREVDQMMQKITDALNADLREFVIKTAELKDVKDEAIKRHMMSWDIDRILRAKANVESVFAETKN